MLCQVDSLKGKAGLGRAELEDQDELQLPNFRKPSRGAAMPLLGQVLLLDCNSPESLSLSTLSCGCTLCTPVGTLLCGSGWECRRDCDERHRSCAISESKVLGMARAAR